MDNPRRDEVVHHEETPGQTSQKKSKDGKKPTLTMKAKSVPVTPETVAASTGPVRERWLESTYKDIEDFLLNMAITDACLSLTVI